MTKKYCNLDDDALERLLAARLTPHRLEHSHAVARRARELAERFGGDPGKAYFAGLTHDICKCDPVGEQLQMALGGAIIPDEAEKHTPSVLHQYAGAVLLERELGVTDPEILGAVRWHCTGRAGMTALEKIVYLADLTGEDRDFPDIGRARAEADRGLAAGMAYCAAKVRAHLLERGFTPSAHEEACWREYGKSVDSRADRTYADME